MCIRDRLHLDNQVEEYIRNGHSIDVPQEELHFKDRMKFAWEHGMVQLFANLPQVIGYDLLFMLCQCTPETAAFRIGFDTVFSRVCLVETIFQVFDGILIIVSFLSTYFCNQER